MADSHTVVVTDRRFPGRDPYSEAVEEAGGELIYGDFQTEEDLIKGCRNADVVVTFKAPMTRDVLADMKDIRLVLRNGAGYDTVDIRAANEFGIPVSTIKGYISDELAEHNIGLMIGAAHEFVRSDQDMRRSDGFGERRKISPIYGGTLGIVGLGHIGRAVARQARGFDLDIIATDPYVPDDIFDALNVKRVNFDELIETADCVSLNCQLTAETHHILSTPEFERMKDTAAVVNTARGPLIDEEALVDAVESGEIFGAGLDVFETEPPTDSPVLDCEKIICSPHHGGSCERTDERCIETGLAEILRAINGEQLQNVVNPEALKYQGDLLSPELDSWTNLKKV